ncbi:MAG: hypothetical protein ABSB74_05930 [Tepidisphaeraceae bacterium]
MPIWLQNLLVVLAVAICAGFLLRQAWLALAGKPSKLGSCCAKGCGAYGPPKPGPGERIDFLPAEMLGRKK